MIEKIDFEGMRRKLKESLNMAGPLITISDPSVAETLALTEPDLLIVDMEHSAIDSNQLQLICIAAGKIPVLARIKGLEKNEIKKVLDSGVYGIIVPGIESVDDAVNAVLYSRFAPEGKRGAGPGRASGYGNEILGYIEGRPLVFVQIETVSALENVERIAEINGLDGLFVGPFDLSIALQTPFSWSNVVFTSAIERVTSAARKHGLITGIYSPIKEEAMKNTASRGFNFLMLGMDREAIVSGYSSAFEHLKKMK